MPDILIFDDDPTIGDFAGELLRGRGLSVEHHLSGAGALDLIQQGRPRLVILDVMMPGLDGLSACRAIKANPATRKVKVAVVTSKNFRQEEQRAKIYGADLFLPKPLDPDRFARSVSELLGLPAAAPTAAGPAPAPVLDLLTGGAALEAPPFLLLLDGSRDLPAWLKDRPLPASAWMLLTRYEEPDAAASAGAALLARGCQVRLYGPDTTEGALQLLGPRLAAAKPSGERALPLLFPVREGEFSLAHGVTAQARYARHPGQALAYRVDLAGRRVVYCPANEVEPPGGTWAAHERAKFRDLFAGADILLHGFRRALEDPAREDNLGNCAWEPVVDLAMEAGVKKLVLIPLAPEAQSSGLEARISRWLESRKSSLAWELGGPGSRFVL